MYEGYLELGGIEIINGARAAAYLRSFVPQLNVRCRQSTDGLLGALGNPVYVSPSADGADWYTAADPATANFYGLFPGKLKGGMDSTRRVEVIEHTGHGATHTSPRFHSKEVRYTALAVGLNDEALKAGLTWLRESLAGKSGESGFGCLGREGLVYNAMVPDLTQVTGDPLRRNILSVETIEGPTILRESSKKYYAAVELEFILNIGRPWLFTLPTPHAVLNMDNALTFTDPAGEDCYEATQAYDSFINDPYFTAISQPPAPPIMVPPNILDIESWRRLTSELPTTTTERWGYTVPVVRVTTGTNAAQQIRIRFYPQSAGTDGCDYDGEYLISYIPANSTMVIDGRTQTIAVQLPSGEEVPGTHLIYGSDGRPFMWAELGSHELYNATVDMMPGQTGISVAIDLSVRE